MPSTATNTAAVVYAIPTAAWLASTYMTAWRSEAGTTEAEFIGETAATTTTDAPAIGSTVSFLAGKLTFQIPDGEFGEAGTSGAAEGVVTLGAWIRLHSGDPGTNHTDNQLTGGSYAPVETALADYTIAST